MEFDTEAAARALSAATSALSSACAIGRIDSSAEAALLDDVVGKLILTIKAIHDGRSSSMSTPPDPHVTARHAVDDLCSILGLLDESELPRRTDFKPWTKAQLIEGIREIIGGPTDTGLWRKVLDLGTALDGVVR